jgi:hypothetical protein
VALLAGATVVILAWPSPASGDTSLGGYSGTAQAEPIRIQIYEPVIPIPASPQIDGGIAYTKSSTDTGPVSRGTASYLWPGDTVGDGFGQLAGNDKAQYPIQVNSRFPATTDAPAHNTGQLTDGNGMTTSSSDKATKATVTGLGIAGLNVLGNPLGGLSNLPGLGGKKSTAAPKVPKLPVPVPVSKSLAGLATVANVNSESDVVLGKNSITSTARATMSEVKLLGGIITIGGVDMTSKSVSNGKKATTTGQATIAGVTVAGTALKLDQTGISLGGSAVKLPVLPDLLTTLGISIKYLQTTHDVQGATGSLHSTGLVLSIDTAPLKTALRVGALVDVLAKILAKIPNSGQLSALLNLGPKIVFNIGDVTSSATAAPAFTGGGTGSTGGTSTGGGTGSTGGGTGSTGGTGTGSLGGGTGSLGGGTGNLGGGTGTSTPGTTNPTPQATGFNLPALGAIPKFLILGALALAAAMAWVLRTAGAFLLGGGRNCAFGLPTGVPDLRKE